MGEESTEVFSGAAEAREVECVGEVAYRRKEGGGSEAKC